MALRVSIKQLLVTVSAALLISGAITVVMKSVSPPQPKNWKDLTLQQSASKLQLSMTKEKDTTYQSLCHNTVIPPQNECTQLMRSKSVEVYPLHFVSGAPGSGNAWVLWLSSLLYNSCELYQRARLFSGSNQWTVSQMNEMLQRGDLKQTNCLYLKSHEPWFVAEQPSLSNIGISAGLLLRHPYDAAFAEYKRMLIEVQKDIKDLKRSTVGVTTEKFINIATNATSAEFANYLTTYSVRWMFHANYWLTEYPNPLHVLIYDSVKDNTVEEIENLQRFFGYKFDEVNLRQHCCYMADTKNPRLKRAPSEVDLYKEVIYKQEQDVHKQMEQNVAKVNKILKERFVGENLVLRRG